MTIKAGIDQDALIEQFAQAGTKQAAALRQAVSEATLRALQGRELTLQNVRKVLKTVTEAASTGAAQNSAPPAQVEKMLASAFDGMDAALLQAVEAHRRALQQFIDQGVGLQQGGVKNAIAEIEKLEDALFASVGKVAQSAGGPLEGPWSQVLEAMKLKGTDTGAQASMATEQLMQQARTAMRDGRAMSLKAGQVLMDSYAALVSGVLIGMSEGLAQGSSAAKPAAPARKR
jgi:hypothetical protein